MVVLMSVVVNWEWMLTIHIIYKVFKGSIDWLYVLLKTEADRTHSVQTNRI